MSTEIMFILITVITVFVLNYINVIDANRFVGDTAPFFKFLMEDDYKFLLSVKYGSEVSFDVDKLFKQRISNALIALVIFAILLLTNVTVNNFFISVLVAIGIAFLVFKLPYIQLKTLYKKNLYRINLMLPYYLKSLEILIQHYTVPVAIARSIDTAPEIFKPGLQKLISRIEAGDMSVDPYMDFAKEYPVRDSMRMMRLLYRLSLGSQENKQEQLMMFAKTVSTLQNKAREQKYKSRLEKMEQKTMMMLVCTGGGIILLLLLSITRMMMV